MSDIKARAPAEVVGAHLRFLARNGTWERLLLDLHHVLETTIAAREKAMCLLAERVLRDARSACGRRLRTRCETSHVSDAGYGSPG